MKKDKIFADKKKRVGDFDFGVKTAQVFDDMLTRSVPFYSEVQRMMAEMAADFAEDGTNVYDLGCSTGTTLEALDPLLTKNVRLVGIDSSPEMLKKAREKMARKKPRHEIEFLQADLNQSLQLSNASVVILNLTLQFVRPLYRQKLMADIAQGLNKNGCLLLIEKVLGKDSTLNRLFIKNYYAFKERNGYSSLEISQKREALENILVPYQVNENIELVMSSGFSECEVFFKWYNFCGFIGVK